MRTLNFSDHQSPHLPRTCLPEDGCADGGHDVLLVVEGDVAPADHLEHEVTHVDGDQDQHEAGHQHQHTGHLMGTTHNIIQSHKQSSPE